MRIAVEELEAMIRPFGRALYDTLRADEDADPQGVLFHADFSHETAERMERFDRQAKSFVHRLTTGDYVDESDALALAQAVAPEGYVILPKEPDEATIEVVAQTINAAMQGDDLPFEPDIDKDQRWHRERCLKAARAAVATLAGAPPPPREDRDGGGENDDAG